MVSFNVTEEPRVPNPALLLHPPIPIALGGVNPRTIKGQEWWDVVRREAYAKYDYHCWACDVHRLDTDNQKLDAHECYNYNYIRKRAYFVGVVALCRDCHMFIHWRRIRYRKEMQRVLTRGLRVLYEAGIGLPYAQTRRVRYYSFGPSGLEFLDTGGIDPSLPLGAISGDWKLVFEGKLYQKGVKYEGKI